jgi:hypothetical protein
MRKLPHAPCGYARASTAPRSVSPISTTLRRVPASVLVHVVRSGGVSSDSALPLVGFLRGQAAGRNIYMGPVTSVAHDMLLAPCTLVPTATAPRATLSGPHLLYYTSALRWAAPDGRVAACVALRPPITPIGAQC